MRIQEMRSGFAHLKKKAESAEHDNVYVMHPVPKQDPWTLADDPSVISSVSELEEARWAVISFDKVEASPLTYSQAEDWLAELDLRNVPGLCIVSIETAERINS
jgi:hypothetical protein